MRDPLDLSTWIPIKERGALTRTGHVFRSPDGGEILRTGQPDVIAGEADFAREVFRRGFPTPEVTGSGRTTSGLGYFTERSVGDHTFGQIFRDEYAAHGAISARSFEAFVALGLRFVAAQLDPRNRPTTPSELRAGIQLANVLEENPDIDPALLEAAVRTAESRLAALPLVLSNGDLTPFNALEHGIIDFENRFIAPVGYDAITYVTFHRFWDHPRPDGTGTLRHWEFTPTQMTNYLTRLDAACTHANTPPLSPYFDDLLMLKSIWALNREKTNLPHSPQARRWLWRKRVTLHCLNHYLAGQPLDSERFRAIGLGVAAGEEPPRP